MREIFFGTILFFVFSLALSTESFAASKNKAIFKNPVAEKQAEFLKQKIKANDKDIESRLKLGKILLMEEMPREAAAEFRKALEIDGKNIKVRILLANALKKDPKADLKKITNILEEASLLAPEDGEVHLNLAQVYVETGMTDSAIKEFKSTIELSLDEASLVSAHLGLMAIYKKQGDDEKAAAEYDKARKICPAVDEVIKNIEISQITPAPKYADQELKDGEGFYPSYAERVEKARKEIKKTSEKK